MRQTEPPYQPFEDAIAEARTAGRLAGDPVPPFGETPHTRINLRMTDLKKYFAVVRHYQRQADLSEFRETRYAITNGLPTYDGIPVEWVKEMDATELLPYVDHGEMRQMLDHARDEDFARLTDACRKIRATMSAKHPSAS